MSCLPCIRRTVCAVLIVCLLPTVATAQNVTERRLTEAGDLMLSFAADDTTAIPAELLERARGIAVIPNVFRGGFILGARRGRGILTIRDDSGRWSNPAFVTLTGGSIGWQLGGESTDLVLVFANDNSVRNITSGKFTLGGDASAVAGPLGRQATMAVTFRAEVYSYVRSRGLFAGAAFEGARLDIDEEAGAAFYPEGTRPLQPLTSATPRSAAEFLRLLSTIAPPQNRPVAPRASPAPDTGTSNSGAQTFPLEN